MGAVGQGELRPQDGAHAALLGGHRKANGPVQAIVVGEGQRPHPQGEGAVQEGLGGRGAIEHRKARMAVEFHIVAHSYTRSRYHASDRRS